MPLNADCLVQATSDRNLHCSWDKYIHRSIWIGKLFNDYVLNLVGTNVSGTMGECVHECECLCRCANILALVFSCLPRSSRPHNASRDRLNYCSTSASQQIYNRVLFVSIASAFDIPIMSLESLLFMFSHEYLPLFECINALKVNSVSSLKVDDYPLDCLSIQTWLRWLVCDELCRLWPRENRATTS